MLSLRQRKYKYKTEEIWGRMGQVQPWSCLVPGEYFQGSSRQLDLKVWGYRFRNHQYLAGNNRIQRDERDAMGECWGREWGPREKPEKRQSLKDGQRRILKERGRGAARGLGGKQGIFFQVSQRTRESTFQADCGQQRQVLSQKQIRKRLRGAMGEHLLARSRVSGSRSQVIVSWTNGTNECRQLSLKVCLKSGRYNPWVFFSTMGKWGHREGSLTTFPLAYLTTWQCSW